MDNATYPQEYQEGFVIDSPGKADWACQQIKAERARTAIYVTAARENIARQQELIRQATEKCERENGYLLCLLEAYMKTVPAKETKTQKSFVLPSGKLVLKLAKVRYEHDDEALLAWCKETAPDMVRVKETPAWDAIKKQILAGGELPDGVTPVEDPESFEVE